METTNASPIRKAVAVGLVLAAALTACAKAAPATAGIAHRTGPADLVLRVDICCGFIDPTFAATQVPTFSLFGDGSIVTTGVHPEIYPGQAIEGLLVRHVDEAGIQAILKAARDAGLMGPSRKYTSPSVADAGTTIFTLVANGEKHVISVYALGEATGQMTGPERTARQALQGLLVKLTGLQSWLPKGSLSTDHPYRPQAVRVFVRLGRPSSQELTEPSIAWPLAPLATFGAAIPGPGPEALRCGVVRGADLQTLLPLIGRANVLTPWTSGGHPFSLSFRPLLPDESGCTSPFPGAV